MASTLATEAYENLTIEFSDEDGVTVADGALLVHGSTFAWLDGDDLVVDVPAARAADLTARGVAKHFTSEGVKSRDLVRVADLSLWSELAREAHEYVGEPAVGGDS